MTLAYFVYALPIAIAWLGITNSIRLDSLLIGYGLGLVLLFASRPRLRVRWRKLPDQLLALGLYIGVLHRDVILSGVDLARRMLSRDMRLKPGVIAVQVGDDHKSGLVTALSADVISLTPGELVIDVEDNAIMYVHCLDVEASEQTIHQVQARRLALLSRIMGRE